MIQKVDASVRQAGTARTTTRRGRQASAPAAHPKKGSIALEVTPDVFADKAFQKTLKALSATASVTVSVKPATSPQAQAPPAAPPVALPPSTTAPLPAPTALAVPRTPIPIGIIYAGLVMPPPGHVSPTPGLALIGLVPWMPAPQPQAAPAPQPQAAPAPQPQAAPAPQHQAAPAEIANPYASTAPSQTRPSDDAPAVKRQTPAAAEAGDDTSSLTPMQRAGCAMMLGLSLLSGVIGGVIGAHTRPSEPGETSVSQTCPTPATHAPAPQADSTPTPATPAPAPQADSKPTPAPTTKPDAAKPAPAPQHHPTPGHNPAPRPRPRWHPGGARFARWRA